MIRNYLFLNGGGALYFSNYMASLIFYLYELYVFFLNYTFLAIPIKLRNIARRIFINIFYLLPGLGGGGVITGGGLTSSLSVSSSFPII